jgi:O-antigen/teichoic acid export membrane protein
LISSLRRRTRVRSAPEAGAPAAGAAAPRARRAAGWAEEFGILTFANVLLKLRALLLLPLVTRLLGVGPFGIWIQVTAVVALGSEISELGLQTAAVRLVAGTEDRDETRVRYWTIFCTALALALAGGLVFFLLAPLLAVWLTRDAGTTHVFRLAAVLMPLTTLTDVQSALTRGLHQIRRYAVLKVLISGGELLACVGALLLVPALSSALVAMLAWRATIGTVLLLSALRRVPFTLPRTPTARAALAYSLPTVPGSVSRGLLDKADRFVIGFFLGPVAVAAYGAAYTFAQLLLQVVQPLREMMVPRLGRLWDRGERAQVLGAIALAWRYFLLLAIPAAVGLGVLGEEVLRLLTTPELARQGGGLVGWIAVGIVLFGANMLVNQVFFAGQWTGRVALVYGTGAVFNVLLNLVLVPRMGLMGAAAATILSYLLTFAMAYRFARAMAGLTLPLAPVAHAAAAAALMWLAVSRVEGAVGGWPGVLLAMATGIAVYAAALLGEAALLRRLGRGGGYQVFPPWRGPGGQRAAPAAP